MAAPDFDALARAIVVAAGKVPACQASGPIDRVISDLARQLTAAWQPAEPSPPAANDERQQWKTARWAERAYRVDALALLSMMRDGWEIIPPIPARVPPAVIPTEQPDYSAPSWTANEGHCHIIGGITFTHAHEGGHEAHSAVTHDLSDARVLAADEVAETDTEHAEATWWCTTCGLRDALHAAPCAGGQWSRDGDAARQTRYALGGEPASMGGDA